MEYVLLFLLSLLVLLPATLGIKSVLKKNKVIKKSTEITLNAVLALMLAGYVMLNHYLIIASEPYASDGVILASLFLFVSPFFWVVMIHFMNLIFFRYRINKKAKITGIFDYYRDDLQKAHPGLLSFIYRFKIDAHTNITAVLLKLKLEGHIGEQGDTLFVTGKSADGLLESEKLVLRAVSNGYFDLQEYTAAVKHEAQALELVKKTGTSESKKTLTIIFNFIMPFLVLLVIYVGASVFNAAVSGSLSRIYRDGIWYIEVSEWSYNEFYSQEYIDRFLEEYRNLPSDEHYPENQRRRPIEEQEERLRVRGYQEDGKYYANASQYVGWSFFDEDIFLAVFVIASFFVLVIAISQAATRVKCFKYDFIRTPMGTQILNEAFGLKNFLKDFTIIEQRKEEELPLWEYYLIYAVVLDVNVIIEDKVISRFVDTISAMAYPQQAAAQSYPQPAGDYLQQVKESYSQRVSADNAKELKGASYPGRGFTAASKVLGIVSLPFIILYGFGIGFAFIGLAFGLAGKKNSDRAGVVTKAKWGIWVSAAGLVANAIMLVFNFYECTVMLSILDDLFFILGEWLFGLL